MPQTIKTLAWEVQNAQKVILISSRFSQNDKEKHQNKKTFYLRKMQCQL